MSTVVVCPLCKKEYSSEPALCSNCNFPFNADENTRGKFIGQQIMKKGRISETKDSVKWSRYVLFFIGFSVLVSPLLANQEDPYFELEAVVSSIIGLLFLGLAILTVKWPLFSFLVALVILLSSYAIEYLIDPVMLLDGILWKFIMVTALFLSIAGIVRSNAIRSQSNYLKSKDYR